MLRLAESQPPQLPSETPRVKIREIRERSLSDEEFSWYTTNFHVWPGEHCPVLKRQADMGLAIKTTDDDLEESRTS
jgi:hypothetical protein